MQLKEKRTNRILLFFTIILLGLFNNIFGQMIVTEIYSVKEYCWFELYNPSDSVMYVNSISIPRVGTPNIIPDNKCITIGKGEIIVFCSNMDKFKTNYPNYDKNIIDIPFMKFHSGNSYFKIEYSLKNLYISSLYMDISDRKKYQKNIIFEYFNPDKKTNSSNGIALEKLENFSYSLNFEQYCINQQKEYVKTKPNPGELLDIKKGDINE